MTRVFVVARRVNGWLIRLDDRPGRRLHYTTDAFSLWDEPPVAGTYRMWREDPGGIEEGYMSNEAIVSRALPAPVPTEHEVAQTLAEVKPVIAHIGESNRGLANALDQFVQTWADQQNARR